MFSRVTSLTALTVAATSLALGGSVAAASPVDSGDSDAPPFAPVAAAAFSSASNPPEPPDCKVGKDPLHDGSLHCYLALQDYYSDLRNFAENLYDLPLNFCKDAGNGWAFLPYCWFIDERPVNVDIDVRGAGAVETYVDGELVATTTSDSESARVQVPVGPWMVSPTSEILSPVGITFVPVDHTGGGLEFTELPDFFTWNYLFETILPVFFHPSSNSTLRPVNLGVDFCRPFVPSTDGTTINNKSADRSVGGIEPGPDGYTLCSDTLELTHGMMEEGTDVVRFTELDFVINADNTVTVTSFAGIVGTFHMFFSDVSPITEVTGHYDPVTGLVHLDVTTDIPGHRAAVVLEDVFHTA
ncbi:MAG: hypothetical protein AAGF73_04610 [Actinomycetota bacterium]